MLISALNWLFAAPKVRRSKPKNVTGWVVFALIVVAVLV